LLYCVTVPLSAWTLLRGQLAHFRAHGYDVHLACSPGPALPEVATREGVTVHEIPMNRDASSPLRDAGSLVAMTGLMRRLRPDIVNAGTPKAGLVGMLAARLAGTGARVYVMRGLRLETAAGTKRRALGLAERLACRCAHTVLCVSESLRDEAVSAGLVEREKTVVIGAGSSNGVEIERFRPDGAMLREVARLRDELHLDDDSPTVGFIGRLTRDKGVVELVDAFELLYDEDPSRRLLLVGDAEDGDPLPERTARTLRAHPGIVRTGFVPETAPYYQLMDVLCLPSHREGFPNAPLEAAAAGRPTVTTDATGARDSVIDGQTGRIIARGDTSALAEALRELLSDRAEARRMGARAQRRAAAEYAPERVWSGLAELYRDLLER
ncbi:MAG TPA: glycosyltransferase family 4 protein, partial [Desulfobacterales bacterium]|nr:glycosyltransferase family 4 protein [Desulfobacterales bacterium]